MRREILICLALSAIVLIGFWPVGHLGFILFDDHDYITENPNVQAGITVKSVCWAFTNKYSYNWHPVTWLSHMLDYKLFGLNAGGHHWMNLGFHTANVLLLFLVLNRMMGLRQNEVAPTATQPGLSTPAGTVWRNALVAALFALHPLHLQSVAWVSERKDLLSGFFAMLTLWAWVRYVEKSKVQSPRSKVFYGLALIFFALGLMSKPMLVTVPFVLLLLDYWPLRRISDFGFRISDLTSVLQPRKGAWPRGAGLHGFTHSTFNHLLFEKLPFVALSLVSCIVTMRVQSVVPSDWVPWDCRLENALVSYAAYLGKFCWPENLAIFYPYPQISLWKVFGPGLLLVGLSVFCIRRMHSQPWLFVGWFWFAVMLLPVIGLVQVGMQSMADRYTYLPSIGLFIIVAWGMAGIASISSLWRTGMVVGAAGVAVGLSAGDQNPTGLLAEQRDTLQPCS